MPIPAYATIQGKNQGEISAGSMSVDSVGTLSYKGQEDAIQVQEFELGVEIPTDPQSGQPTGRRIHTGLRLIKYIDKSSPMLLQAIASGEQLETVEIQFFRTSATGTQEHYYTIKIEEATLVRYRPHFPNSLDPDTKGYAHMEELLFQYKAIEMTHVVGGTSGRDSWDE